MHNGGNVERKPTVLSSIDKEIVSFYERTGRRPTRAYLGYQEYDEIATSGWLKVRSYYAPYDKTEYSGLSIYRVKEETHLFVT